MSALSLALDTPELAEHYERASVDRQFKTGKQLIERLAIGTGDRVLDVGAGTGLLAAHVAKLVGASGSVYAIDPLPLRVEIARRKSEDKPNLQFAVDNAYDLRGLPDASFDVVYLNAVFHWFPEKQAPLANFHRLLKRGGKLGISTGSKDHKNRIHALSREVLSRDPYERYLRPEQGLPQRVNAEELRALLERSSFEVQSLSVEPHTTYHADAAAAIEHSQASSFGNLLGHLPEGLRERARQELALALEQYRTPEGIRQDGARIIAVAIKR